MQHDLTLKVAPIDPHKFNEPKLIQKHHEATLVMAQKYGFNPDELSLLKRELRTQITEYAQFQKRQARFEQVKSTMDMMDKVKMDAELREKARALHQDLYRIKMKALRNAKKAQVAGWTELEDMASMEEFTDDERLALKAEITAHVLDEKKFSHQHEEYQRRLSTGLKAGKIETEDYHKKQEMSKAKVVQQQMKAQSRDTNLRNKMRARFEL